MVIIIPEKKLDDLIKRLENLGKKFDDFTNSTNTLSEKIENLSGIIENKIENLNSSIKKLSSSLRKEDNIFLTKVEDVIKQFKNKIIDVRGEMESIKDASFEIRDLEKKSQKVDLTKQIGARLKDISKLVSSVQEKIGEK
ncbi:MAG: hypothetical protein GF329_13955 [Candidatus Lokiarchaeota archaeon]|nr:hypothetical protein [Candidatus Lokiarchaeota archaeon]